MGDGLAVEVKYQYAVETTQEVKLTSPWAFAQTPKPPSSRRCSADEQKVNKGRSNGGNDEGRRGDD